MAILVGAGVVAGAADAMSAAASNAAEMGDRAVAMVSSPVARMPDGDDRSAGSAAKLSGSRTGPGNFHVVARHRRHGFPWRRFCRSMARRWRQGSCADESVAWE